MSRKSKRYIYGLAARAFANRAKTGKVIKINIPKELQLSKLMCCPEKNNSVDLR